MESIRPTHTSRELFESEYLFNVEAFKQRQDNAAALNVFLDEHWGKPASAEEILAHMINCWSATGNPELTLWRTRRGRWIDVSALEELVQRGVVLKLNPTHWNMWTSPKYILNIWD